jgi:hypothetical protein
MLRRCDATRATLKRVSAALLAAGVLAGCASPQISASFPGLESLAPAGDGSAATRRGPARLFIIHGMTHHDNNYADLLVGALAGRLGLSQSDPRDDSREVPEAVLVGGRPAAINLRTWRLSDAGGERLRVTALTWSALTDSLKRAQFKTDDDLPRVAINGAIKRGVIDDGIGDAALYLGQYGKVMRRGVVMALCAFLDGNFAGDRCDASAQNDAPVAFIAESLGSSMLFDGVRALNQPATAQSLAGRTLLLFMFANQLPVIELAAIPPATSRTAFTLTPMAGRLESFLRAHAAASSHLRGLAAAPAPHIDVVAFTDPSDLLSYPLDRQNTPDASLENVVYPVATRWLGLFANPLTAHTGYDQDDTVLSLVVCGSSGCAQ